MKIFKRILTIFFCVLTMFCVLCTSVFAAIHDGLPEFGWPFYSDYLNLYHPCSNLQSILLRGYNPDSQLNNLYYELLSPYSMFDVKVSDWFDEFDGQGDEIEYGFGIGHMREQNSNYKVNFSVWSVINYFDVGDAQYAVNTIDFPFGVYDFLDIFFCYADAAIPFAHEPEWIVGRYSEYPFFPEYKLLVYSWTGEAPPDVNVTISGEFMTFEYGSDSYGFDFESGPYYEFNELNLTYSWVFNDDLSNMNSVDTYECVISISDPLVDLARSLMIDDTSNSDVTDESYLVYRDMRVRIDWDYFDLWEMNPDADLDLSNLYVSEFFIREELYSELKRSPEYAKVIEFFTINFPVYDFPEGIGDIDFTDFLDSVLYIFNIPLIGDFALSELLFGVAGIGLLIWFIKMFAGG